MEKNTEKPRKKQKKYECKAIRTMLWLIINKILFYSDRVVCRVRPLLRREIEYAGNTTGAVFDILSNRFVSIVSEADKPRALFQFDKVRSTSSDYSNFCIILINAVFLSLFWCIRSLPQTRHPKNFSIMSLRQLSSTRTTLMLPIINNV